MKADQKARGRYLGGILPFGFRLGDDGELVAHEAEQEATIRCSSVSMCVHGRSRRVHSALRWLPVKWGNHASSDWIGPRGLKLLYPLGPAIWSEGRGLRPAAVIEPHHEVHIDSFDLGCYAKRRVTCMTVPSRSVLIARPLRSNTFSMGAFSERTSAMNS